MSYFSKSCFLFFIFWNLTKGYWNPNGVDFEDYFKRHESLKWVQDHGLRHCGGSGGCVYASDENLKYLSHQPIGNLPVASNEMQITMRSDCRGDHCCRNDIDFYQCTSYTSGHITSKQLYGYGSFYLMARMAKLSLGDRGAQSCFALRRVVEAFHHEIHMGMSMCFPSNDPYKVILICRYGEQIHKQMVHLPFDSSQRIGLYRIDWHPDGVVWNVNRKPVGEIRTEMFMIPDNPLHIKLFVIPEVPLEKLGIASNQSIQCDMHVFMAAYQKIDVPNAQTELFTTETLSPFHDIPFIIFNIFAISLFILVVMVWWKNYFEVPQGYSHLRGEPDLKIQL